MNAITLFCLALIVLPVGSVRIGGKDAKPDYSYAGWIAMMFAAGIGIGLLFFGVLEYVQLNRDAHRLASFGWQESYRSLKGPTSVPMLRWNYAKAASVKR